MRKLAVISLLLLLVACQEPPPPAPLEPLAFTGSSYTFNVAGITVAQDYKSPKRPPNVEHLADITPAQAVKRWAGTRLMAAGHQNSLEVDIKDASIVRMDLPKQKTGLEGMFTNEQTERYDGTLEVEMKIYSSSSALPVGHLDVVTHESLTLPEDAAPIDREHVYHRMTVDMMRALEPQLDTSITRYLSKYLL